MFFLRPEDGGRQGPARSGYRPQFYYEGHDWDTVHTYIGTDRADPGTWVRAYLAFLSPEEHLGRLTPGTPFLVREGARALAYGTVTAILDLPASARRAAERGPGTSPEGAT
jgi:translation elongation factor EF-Tu-like GTPase